MSTQRNRRRSRQEEDIQNPGGIFIQILACIAIVCCFMFFKDTPLPGGKTPAAYAKHFLEYTVNFDGILARFRDESVTVNGGTIEEALAPTPTPTPAPEEEDE